MVQKLGFYSLKKRLPSAELNKEVGSVHTKGPGGMSVKRGLVLQKWLTSNLSNKTRGQAKKYLIKYGVQGQQGEKREKMLELMFGDRKKNNLTEARKKSNIDQARRQRLAEESEATNMGAGRSPAFAGGSLASKSAGSTMAKGTMGGIGIKRSETGFAQNFKTKLPDGPAVQTPPAGIKPIGFK